MSFVDVFGDVSKVRKLFVFHAFILSCTENFRRIHGTNLYEMQKEYANVVAA